MENHANKLVRGDAGNFKSKSLSDLNKTPHNHLYTKNIKLSFNKNCIAHHLLISGCSNNHHLGKSFKISKSDSNHLFFKKLYVFLNENKNIPLIKHTTIKGNTFWTKASFNVINENQINFNIDKDTFNYKQEMMLTKLIGILDSLESHSGVAISEKYLVGFLEERGIKTFNDYVNQIYC